MAHGLWPRQAGGSDSSKQVLNLISNPFQQSVQTTQLDAFWASLATSLGIALLLTIVFSLLRPRHTLVYAPKTKHADARHAPPPMGRGPLAWFKPVVQAKESFLVDRIGMDAVFFLRFTRMLRNMFLVLGLLGTLVMIPVNVALGSKSIPRSGFSVMTPITIFGTGMWAQVVLAWVIDIVVIGFLWWNYRKFYQLRRSYFESPEYQQSLSAHSVFLRDIPTKYRHDEGILRLTDEVNPSGNLPRAIPGRDVGVLPDLIEEHEETVRKLESVLAKYLKNPDRLPAQRPAVKPDKAYRNSAGAGKVDAIEYYTNKIKTLEAHIHEERQQSGKRGGMSYGFASWDRMSDAHTVAFAASKKSTHGSKIRLAPRPSDLIWKNIALSRSSRSGKRWINAVWITVLTIIWTPINGGIAIFLSNLANLGSVWPAFQTSLIAHRGWWALVQGIAAPALTSTVYLVLPIIFRRLQIRAGDVTKTSRERHVLRNLYNFFIFNNLIVFSVFSAIWQFVTLVIDDSNRENIWKAMQNAQFFVLLTTALCQMSPFWILWLLQRNLGAAIDLAQLWTLFYVWFAKTFMAPTPRQMIEWTAPPVFDYAAYYNYFLFYTTVALCFATLQPIVLVVTALYFSIDSLMKKYLLMYVFITKNESGGQFWRTLFNRIIFATLLSNVVVGVTVKSRAGWDLVGALVPLLFLMLGFKFYCMKKFDPGMHFYHRTAMQDAEAQGQASNSKAVAKASTKYLHHPALDKPLITPMVSAKAKHVLAQIYSGRTGSYDEHGHSDIAMESMTQNGKSGADAPFELVPEAQQDFAYYKNRSDFREEGGAIYGRPEDLIGSRSGTPGSFMTGYSRPVTPFEDTPYKDGTVTPKHVSMREYTPSPPPAGVIAPIARRAVPGNPSGMHPAFRDSHGGYEQVLPDEGDLSLRHGPYTDPNEDHTNLLRGTADLHTPNGEFMSVDRWQTQGSISNSLTGTPREEPASYDYFRSGRR